MLKLKLQYFGHLMQRADSFEKSLMLGKIEGRRRGQQRIRWLDGITDSMDIILSKITGVGDRQGSLGSCSQFFTLVDQSIGASASASVPPMNIQD